MTTKSEIERVLWNACDSFRGKIDSSRYKDYILSMLFVKYLSDVSEEKREQYREQYDGDERRVERAMSRERFKLDDTSTFGYLYKNRHDSEIGLKINTALASIEDHNSSKHRQLCFGRRQEGRRVLYAEQGLRAGSGIGGSAGK